MSEVNQQSTPSDTTSRDTKNSVFTTQAGLPPTLPQGFSGGNVPSMSKEEYAANLFGFKNPVNQVPLPSRGLVYSVDHPLCNVEEVAIRRMTTQEDNIMNNQVLAKQGVTHLELVRSCLVDKRIDVSTLLQGDFMTLLFAIRAVSVSPVYSPELDGGCPKCESPQRLDVELASNDPGKGLAMKFLGETALQQVQPNANLFRVTLPETGCQVDFKLLTMGDQIAVQKMQQAKQKNGIQSTADVATQTLMSHVVSVNGKSSPTELQLFCTYLPFRDSLFFQKYVADNEPGLVTTGLTFNCKSCGHTQKMGMPMTPEFFRPTT